MALMHPQMAGQTHAQNSREAGTQKSPRENGKMDKYNQKKHPTNIDVDVEIDIDMGILYT